MVDCEHLVVYGKSAAKNQRKIEEAGQRMLATDKTTGNQIHQIRTIKALSSIESVAQDVPDVIG